MNEVLGYIASFACGAGVGMFVMCLCTIAKED